MMNGYKLFAVLLCVAAWSACGGGGAAVAPGGSTGTSPSTQSVKVTLTIVIPGKTTSGLSRHLQYISSSTASASVSVNSGMPTTAPCSTTCTLTVDAPVGSDTFAVSLYDASSHLLSQGSAGATISGTAANTVNIAFGGAVATVVLSSAVSHLVPGSLATAATVSIVTKDADGNTIVGTDPYVHPISLADSDGSGATSLSATSITSPATSSVTFNYTGAGALAGTSVTITPSATGAVTLNPVTFGVYAHHTFLEYPIPSGAYPDAVAAGADGNLWFGESGASEVGYVTPGGTVQQFATGGGIAYICQGSDGNMWFTEFGANRIGRVTPAGTVTEFGGLTGTQPEGIALGSNGSVYVAMFGAGSSGYVDAVTTGGSVSASSQISGGPQTQGIVSGPDNRLWVTEAFPYPGTLHLDAMTTAFALTPYPVPSGAQLRDIVSGPNGHLWVNDSGNDQMDEVTTAGVFVHQYNLGSAYPTGLAVGSDGNLYYGGNGTNVIGQMTPGGVETDFSIPTSGASVSGVASGPDGNIWFAEASATKIGRFIL